MPEIKVVNMAGSEVGKINLSDEVFAHEADGLVFRHLPGADGLADAVELGEDGGGFAA